MKEGLDIQPGTILGLFPSLSLQKFGGIEVSGRVAWAGIVDRVGQNGASLICYAPGEPHTSEQAGVYVHSKPAALRLALQRTGSVRCILVWHLHLLKLLPFFRQSASRAVVFLHGVEAWRRQDIFTRTLLRRVGLFLCNSAYTWQRFVAYHPELKQASHRIVPLGIDSPVDSPVSTPKEPPTALMISRLHQGEDYKGHREMIEAWPQVLTCFPDARLWIAGDGDLRPSLEELTASYGLTDRVRFWGRISEETKQALLTRCCCLALPSRGEGFGLVYLEAMRQGRPCLVSTFDAGREVVNPPEAGLAVDPGQPAVLAGAVGRLFTPDGSWNRWSSQARNRYERHFTAESFQQRLWAALTDHML